MTGTSIRRNPTQLQAIGGDGQEVSAISTDPYYGSASFQWNGFVLERHFLLPGSLPNTIMPHHCLAIPRSKAPTPIQWTVNGQKIEGRMNSGQIYFRAANVELSSSWQAPLDAVFLSINPEALVLNYQEALKNTPLLQSNFSGAHDFGLAQLILELDRHIQNRHLGGALFEQSALLACGLRLASLYALEQPTERPISGTLPRHILARLDEYILSNLSEPLTLDNIAASVNLSVYHLCRKFRKTRNISLWQYVLMCRIAFARRMMQREPDMPIWDIGIASGFDSYTQFYEAFRKFCGTPPRSFSRAVTLQAAEYAQLG
ncbi:AraC family transcriptional regulator [Comamonas testosteroni]|uniref:AraC family transcriptional regulator n=1 Tax=Comamonas testosteroni TaxID=285 RepID=A0A373FCN7_COMTE|nr:AraC family transcriptional regulator [Comamonas testosteroni]